MPTHSAVIFVDLQNDFLTEGGAFSKRHIEPGLLIDACQRLAQLARYQGRQRVWVYSVYGEVEGVAGETHTGAPCCVRGTWGSEPVMAAELDEHVVEKKFYSAFRETGLEQWLKERNLTRLILCGVATNICVRITAEEAQKLGFTVEVVSDACAAGSFGKHTRTLQDLKAEGVKITLWSEYLAEAPTILSGIAAGDTTLWCGFLDEVAGPGTYTALAEEIVWHTMYHRGGAVPRLVAIQGHVEPDGTEPLYRHPVDAQPALVPFTPLVDRIRRAVEARIGHPLNHGLLQLYRTTRDWIGEHSDKTLDLMPGSSIINVSLGITRTMLFKPKHDPTRPHPSYPQRIPMIDRSFLQLGATTNRRFYHAIRQQGDIDDGPRISLTFRHIGSFYHPGSGRVWGTGALYKTRDEAEKNHHLTTPEQERAEADRMVRLFREENIDPHFDQQSYQPGFQVLNLHIFLDEPPVEEERES